MSTLFGENSSALSGYGMFWLANSITSTVLGFSNRKLQEQAAERNLAFQQSLEEARQMAEDEKIREEIAFKHRLLALSRQYRQVQAATAFTNHLQGKELQAFLQRDWPLDPILPHTLLAEIQASMTSTASLPLNVILLHSPLLPIGRYGQSNKGDAVLYKEIEYLISQEDVPSMGSGDVKFRKDACVKTDLNGGNANIMNIHFLMASLPTLVISPRYYEGKLSFSAAVWEAQAARPYIRPLFSLDYEPKISLEDEKYRKEMIAIIHASVSVIIGTVRDLFVLITQGREPSLDQWLNDDRHVKMKNLVKNTPQLLEFIGQEKSSLLEALQSDKNPGLLEAYAEADIRNMRAKLQSVNIL